MRPSSAANSPHRENCVLCGHTTSHVLDLFPIRDLCKIYRKELQVDVTREFPPGHPHLLLRQCERCGLQFFDPMAAGSASFYASLSSGTHDYYSTTRWEFLAVKSLIDPEASVLDVGCGDGHFLSQLSNAQKLGLEFNANAAARAQARGLPVKQDCVENMPLESFHVVTMFHVLEHLANPLEVLQAALRALKPKGLLILSVPNNDAFIGSDLQHAANAPPHHTLRWRAEAFHFLPKLLPLNLQQIQVEPLSSGYAFLYRRTRFFEWVSRTWGIRLPLMKVNIITYLLGKIANVYARIALQYNHGLPDKPAAGFSLLVIYQKR
jgi:SAM-dependent methyltransferase